MNSPTIIATDYGAMCTAYRWRLVAYLLELCTGV